MPRVSTTFTDKDKIFMEMYLGGDEGVRGNATGCYRAMHPGSKDTTCKVKGSRIYNKPKCQEYMRERIAEMQKNTDITVEGILARSVELFETCMGQRSFTVTKSVDKLDANGNPVSVTEEVEVKAFSPPSAGKALELMGKNILVQAFQEKIDITGKVDLEGMLNERQRQVEDFAKKIAEAENVVVINSK